MFRSQACVFIPSVHLFYTDCPTYFNGNKMAFNTFTAYKVVRNIILKIIHTSRKYVNLATRRSVLSNPQSKKQILRVLQKYREVKSDSDKYFVKDMARTSRVN